MKYVKMLMLLGCTVQGALGMEIAQNSEISLPELNRIDKLEKILKNESSRLVLLVDSTFKQGLQIQVQFFNKNGKKVAGSVASFKAPGSVEIPQEATQCTLSAVAQAKGSKMAKTVKFNSGNMMSLNFNNPSYMLSSAKGVYQATPVYQVIRNLENELLNKIYDLSKPQSCGPKTLMPMLGTPEYAEYEKEVLEKETDAQKSHIFTLEQIMGYVDTQIKMKSPCYAM